MHKKIVALMFIAAMLISSPGAVFAFGLGEIEINSALNQPMDAEIELIGFKADQIDEVFVELADQQMFERVGVPRPYILTRLKFTPMISRGKPIIRITSTDAIREPFLTFLIDVRWAKGKLLREFTVLLDPPVFGDKAKAAIQAPKVSTQAPAVKKSAPKSSNIATTPAPRVPTPSVRPKQATVPSTVSKPVTLKKTKSPSGSGGSRAVRRGDTLWSIAEPYARENGVSVNQMMLAIQSANPESFSANNINNLKSGVVLRIPADNLSNYSAKEALAEVQRQWQVWKQGAQATSNAVNVDAGEMPANEAAAPSDSKDQEATKSSKLSILGEGDSAEGKSGDDANATLKELRKQVSLLKESSESKGQENTELKDRIQSLESMIKKQEDIISLQNEQLAQLQNSLTASGSDNGVVEEQIAAVEEAVQEANEVINEAQEAVAGVTSELEEKAESIIKPAKVEPLPDFSGPIPEEFLNAEQDQTSTESLGQQAEIVEEKVVEKIEPSVVEEPVVEIAQESMVEKIMAVLQEQSRNLLYAGGGLLALLLAWLGIKRSRANKESSEVAASGLPAFAEEPSIDGNLDDTVVASPDSVDEALDELEVVDANLDEPVTQDQNDANEVESDDILAEADVYISYGLYQQAEELLKEGLAKDPNNAKYQFKLAEIYHGDKKSDEFVQHIESISDSYNKQLPEWSKIVAMGAALAPAHALFSGSDVASDISQDSVEDDIQAAVSDDVEDLDMGTESLDEFSSTESIEGFDSDDLDDDLDDNSLDFTFDDDSGGLSELNESADDSMADELEDSSTAMLEADLELDAPVDATQAFDQEDSSTAVLEADLDLDTPDDATQAFSLDVTESDDESAAAESDATEVFLDFDQDDLESELNAEVDHGSETAMLDVSDTSSIDLDEAISVDDESEDSDATISVDNDLDEMIDGDSAETAMFDSSMLDLDNPDEVKAFTSGDSDENLGEDTESLEQVQENLTAELETLSFDSDDIDPESMEEDSLPTLQTSEIGKPDIDMDDLDADLAASETGTFEKDMLSDNVTEQFDAGDVGDIDSAMTDLGEFGDDYDLETPSVIEEVGTKLDLAKAFVDMGDEDAAKETLTEVMEQGDQTQIQEAKELLDKLS